MNTRNLRFRSNRFRDVLALFHEDLDGIYGNDETSAMMRMLCEEWLGWSTTQYLLNRDSTINQSDLLRFHWALEDLKRHRPIQHIIGHTDFCGCRIAVNPDVLIPRPETEEIVQWIVDNHKAGIKRILDLCTGSGCIAIALKCRLPEAEVTAVDLSAAALDTARANAADSRAEISFIQTDVLSGELPTDGDFDLIVSNPPYVRDSERAAMQANVLDYDPPMALFVPDDDPLRFYRAIGTYAAKHLTPEGLLVLEINEALGEDTCNLLHALGFRTTLHKDFRGRDRMIETIRG